MIVNHGDVFQCGSHRIMCGDATDVSDVEKLMGNEMAEIAFTSPPYNMSFGKYEFYSDDKSSNQYTSMLNDALMNSIEHVKSFSFFNIQSLSKNKLCLIDFLYSTKKNYVDTIIWDKDVDNNGRRFEYIFIFSKLMKKTPVSKNLENLISINSISNTKRYKAHNAIFTIDLPLFFIQRLSARSVLDLFAGTGTTMIAAEFAKKRSFNMEQSKEYVEMAISRFEELTEIKAIKL